MVYPERYIVGLDVDSTSSHALLFDHSGQPVAQVGKEHTQNSPHKGWVENDPEEIWNNIYQIVNEILQKMAISSNQLSALGISVQRETCLIWERDTGKPVYPALVWQDQRTDPECRRLIDEGYEDEVYQRTGLVIDTYFSATKWAWLLNYIDKNKSNLSLNDLMAGTIDTWIIWKLTQGNVHATDHSNASRTLLMNLEDLEWDEFLLNLFKIPRQILPNIQPSLSNFGNVDSELFGNEIPIATVFGNQQSALFANIGPDPQPGLIQCNHSNIGCFLMVNTGGKIVRSQHKLLSTIAWTTSNNIPTYALEGSLFTTGACIQWLCDLGLIDSFAEAQRLAVEIDDNQGVYFIPALNGLGAPYWNRKVKGAFVGLTQYTKKEHMARAVLEAIAYQVKDIIEAIKNDYDVPIRSLKIDGEVSLNNFLLQLQADVLGVQVERNSILGSKAYGAAYGAGIEINFWKNYRELVAKSQEEIIVSTGQNLKFAHQRYSEWKRAVRFCNSLAK